MPGKDDRIGGDQDADPFEIACVVLDLAGTQKLCHRHIVGDHHHGRAVARSGIVHVVGGFQAAARHELADHGRIAGNVFLEILGELAAIDGVATTRPIAHDDTELLALIEFCDLVGHGAGADGAGGERRCTQTDHPFCNTVHVKLPFNTQLSRPILRTGCGINTKINASRQERQVCQAAPKTRSKITSTFLV